MSFYIPIITTYNDINNNINISMWLMRYYIKLRNISSTKPGSKKYKQFWPNSIKVWSRSDLWYIFTLRNKAARTVQKLQKSESKASVPRIYGVVGSENWASCLWAAVWSYFRKVWAPEGKRNKSFNQKGKQNKPAFSLFKFPICFVNCTEERRSLKYWSMKS